MKNPFLKRGPHTGSLLQIHSRGSILRTPARVLAWPLGPSLLGPQVYILELSLHHVGKERKCLPHGLRGRVDVEAMCERVSW